LLETANKNDFVEHQVTRAGWFEEWIGRRRGQLRFPQDEAFFTCEGIWSVDRDVLEDCFFFLLLS
jgi:hypothetical protein